MASVCFREHKELAKNAGNVGGISYKDIIAPSLKGYADEEERLTLATHAVVHFGYEGKDNELSYHRKLWNEQDSSSGKCRIILIVSTGGRPALATAKHDKWCHRADSTDITYVLFARNQQRVLCSRDAHATKVLQAFYQMTQYDAEAVYAGHLENCPIELRSLFEQPTGVVDFLSALTILCQGFLAVQCEPDGEGGSIIDVPSEVKGRVLKALEKMGWFEAFASEDVRCSLSPGLTELTDDAADWRVKTRDYVLTAEFWNVFGQANTKELEKAVEGEWGGSGFAKSETIKLIAALPLKDGTGAGKGFVTLVAEAYMELVKKLEGSQ